MKNTRKKNRNKAKTRTRKIKGGLFGFSNKKPDANSELNAKSELGEKIKLKPSKNKIFEDQKNKNVEDQFKTKIVKKIKKILADFLASKEKEKNPNITYNELVNKYKSLLKLDYDDKTS